MPINVSEAIDTDTAEIITVERLTGSYVDGIYVKATTPIKFKTLASVQQPTTKDLIRLPEGQRDMDVRKFISLKPLLTASDRDGDPADIALYKSKRYEITVSGDWESYGHTTSMGVRVK